MTDEQWWPLAWDYKRAGPLDDMDDRIGIARVLLPNGIKLSIYDNNNFAKVMPPINVIAHPPEHSFHCGSLLELRCMLIMLSTLYPEE